MVKCWWSWREAEHCRRHLSLLKQFQCHWQPHTLAFPISDRVSPLKLAFALLFYSSEVCKPLSFLACELSSSKCIPICSCVNTADLHNRALLHVLWNGCVRSVTSLRKARQGGCGLCSSLGLSAPLQPARALPAAWGSIQRSTAQEKAACRGGVPVRAVTLALITPLLGIPPLLCARVTLAVQSRSTASSVFYSVVISKQ